MFCKKCGIQIDDMAAKCTSCGVEFRKVAKNISGCWIAGCLTPIIFLILAATVPSILMSNMSEEKRAELEQKRIERSKEEEKTSVKKRKPKLEVLKAYNCKLSSYGGSAVCGIVVNNSSKTMSYVQVSVNIYDLNGTLLNSTLANVNNLAPDAKWEFKAPVMQEGRYNWEIADVTGF